MRVKDYYDSYENLKSYFKNLKINIEIDEFLNFLNFLSIFCSLPLVLIETETLLITGTFWIILDGTLTVLKTSNILKIFL